MTVEAFWRAYLDDMGLPRDTAYLECFHFELSERTANELLTLTLRGRKRATCSSLRAYELNGERVPASGDRSIVTDWAGEPRCVIRTTGTRALAFKNMTFDICRREGEDDSLASWQAGHRRFFEEEGAALGYAFTDDMPVLFEDFIAEYWLTDDGRRIGLRTVRNDDAALRLLVGKLDAEAAERYGALQKQYDAHNSLADVREGIVLLMDGAPAACGALKWHDASRAELKRVFVDRALRGRGLAKRLIAELEAARLAGACELVAETGRGQPEAIALYRGLSFETIGNFGPYTGLDNSVCLRKKL